MSDAANPTKAEALERALWRTRLATWGLLALCAVLAVLQERRSVEPPPGGFTPATALALALGVGSMIARRAAQSAPDVRSQTLRQVAALAFAAGLGLVGAWTGTPVFALVGVLFCIQPRSAPLRPTGRR